MVLIFYENISKNKRKSEIYKKNNRLQRSGGGTGEPVADGQLYFTAMVAIPPYAAMTVQSALLIVYSPPCVHLMNFDEFVGNSENVNHQTYQSTYA